MSSVCRFTSCWDYLRHQWTVCLVVLAASISFRALQSKSPRTTHTSAVHLLRRGSPQTDVQTLKWPTEFVSVARLMMQSIPRMHHRCRAWMAPPRTELNEGRVPGRIPRSRGRNTCARKILRDMSRGTMSVISSFHPRIVIEVNLPLVKRQWKMTRGNYPTKITNAQAQTLMFHISQLVLWTLGDTFLSVSKIATSIGGATIPARAMRNTVFHNGQTNRTSYSHRKAIYRAVIWIASRRCWSQRKSARMMS